MWLHVPSLSSPSAPESDDSNQPSMPPPEALASSVTWRGKRSPPRTWSLRCKRVSWLRLLSGLTFEPSTASDGVDSWISSALASRASLTPSPGVSSVSRITAGCSTTSTESSATFDRLRSFLRTSPHSRLLASPRSSRGSLHAGSMRSGTCFQRPRRERPISESDSSSLLPTPTASSYGSRNNGNPGDGREEYATKAAPSLETMARAGDFGDPGDLNPRFVEWMMDVPIGLTDFAHLETLSSASRRS